MAEYRPSQKVRSQPIRIGPQEGEKTFNLDDLWRPREYTNPRFQFNSYNLVLDESLPLLWQRAGSIYPLPWEQAHNYILSPIIA